MYIYIYVSGVYVCRIMYGVHSVYMHGVYTAYMYGVCIRCLYNIQRTHTAYTRRISTAHILHIAFFPPPRRRTNTPASGTGTENPLNHEWGHRFFACVVELISERDFAKEYLKRFYKTIDKQISQKHSQDDSIIDFTRKFRNEFPKRFHTLIS